MRIHVSEENCCGCGSCAITCPFDVIQMKTDSKGHTYPVIDEKACKDCGMCGDVCTFRDKKQIFHPDGQVYAVRLRTSNERMKSRSGGAFEAIASHVIRQGGIVYGCVLDEHMHTRHTKACCLQEVQKMRKVKYEQSNSFFVYQEIAELLKESKLVLFTGLPCQTAGLWSFLGKNRIAMDSLYLIDMVCHGVPGRKIWDDYLCDIKVKSGPVRDVDFRDKRYGWHAHKETFFLENGQEKSTDIYARMFWEDLLMRPSCFHCPYHGAYRFADLTIGDFWGIEKELVDYSDETGVSLVITRSEKGEQLFESLKSTVQWEKSLTDAYRQPNLFEATQKPENYDEFWKDYERKGFLYIEKKYGKVSIWKRLKSKL